MTRAATEGMSPKPSTGPRGHWLTGNMGAYNADPLAFVQATVREFGDFVPLRLGPIRGYLLSNPRDIESVLVEHNRSFRKSRGLLRTRTLLGNGILLSDGEHWLRHRRLMQPAFHRQMVERYADVMVARIEAALDRWGELGVLDAAAETRRMALQIATETLFGADVTEAEASEIGAAIETASAQLQTRISSFLMFVPDWVPTPGNRRMNAAIGRIDELVFRVIRERQRSSEKRNDLLGLLLTASNGEVGSLDERELRDEVVTLLLAGHETTALTLAWAMHEVAAHPEIGADLRNEALSVLGPDRSPTPADFPRLPLAAGIVNETLRLYPAAYLTAREATQDVEINGRRIPKRSLVLMSQWEQQREPATFEDADEFRPQRWYTGLAKELERGQFFPFGMGPRMCIGASFANLELMLSLPMIGRRFTLEPTSGDRPRPVPKVALNPDRPILLRLRPAS